MNMNKHEWAQMEMAGAIPPIRLFSLRPSRSLRPLRSVLLNVPELRAGEEGLAEALPGGRLALVCVWHAPLQCLRVIFDEAERVADLVAAGLASQGAGIGLLHAPGGVWLRHQCLREPGRLLHYKRAVHH